jgi:hypothetical protein
MAYNKKDVRFFVSPEEDRILTRLTNKYSNGIRRDMVHKCFIIGLEQIRSEERNMTIAQNVRDHIEHDFEDDF